MTTDKDSRPAASTSCDKVSPYNALLVAFVGSGLIGFVECALIITQAASTSSRVDRDTVVLTPIDCLAAYGMIAATHVIVWMPVFLVWTLCISAARKGLSFIRKLPLAGLNVAAFIVIAGSPVVVTNLATAQVRGFGARVSNALAIILLLVAGVVAVRGIAYLHCRGWYKYFTRALVVGGVGLGALMCLGFAVLARSEFYDPTRTTTSQVAFESASTGTGGSARNVVLIVLDTVRADRLSSHGYGRETTPFLEELCDSATVFERAVSPSMWTMPTHASIFTGKYRRSHGVDWSHMWLDERFTTLGEHARDKGYQTGFFSNNTWVSRSSNLTQGFDTVEYPGALAVLHWFSARQLLMEHVVPRWPGLLRFLPWLEHDKGAARTNRRVDAWLEKTARGESPFFLFINYFEAHCRYEPPLAHRRKFMTSDEVARSYAYKQSPWLTLVRPMLLSQQHDRETLDMLRNLYDALLFGVDARLRELFSMIHKRGLLEETLIVIVSDHGEHLGEHGQFDHKYSVYQPLIHVPLIVRGPGVRAQRVSTPTSTLDLHRWILNVFESGDPGLTPTPGEPPAQNDHCFSELADPCTHPFIQLAGTNTYIDLKRWIRSLNSIQGPRWKLVSASDGTNELYDLLSDPNELNDLSAERPDVVEELTARMTAKLAQIEQYEPEVEQDETRERSQAEMERLRSLGYVQ